MGWVDFMLLVGLRFRTSNLAEARAKLRALGLPKDVTLTSLATKLDGTERGREAFDSEEFEGVGEDDAYFLYFNSLELSNSNGETLDVNLAYSSGQIEFYTGKVKKPLMPTAEERAHLSRAALALEIPDELAWSLRARGSWANTRVEIEDVKSATDDGGDDGA